jgi:hypothetical protein
MFASVPEGAAGSLSVSALVSSPQNEGSQLLEPVTVDEGGTCTADL